MTLDPTDRFTVQPLGNGYFVVRDNVTGLDVANWSSETEAQRTAARRTEEASEVNACTSIHSAAPVAKCAGCGICEECDVTLDLGNDGRARCEACRDAAENGHAEIRAQQAAKTNAHRREVWAAVTGQILAEEAAERAQEPGECRTCGEPADADGRIEHRPGTPCTTDGRP